MRISTFLFRVDKNGFPDEFAGCHTASVTNKNFVLGLNFFCELIKYKQTKLLFIVKI